MRQVAVLFARADSIYKTLPGCDVWDIERDARKWPGGAPIVGHPPCRTWSSLSHFCTQAAPGEKELAPWCVEQIRKWGGVLEHPPKSKLWPHMKLPEPGAPRDKWGGFTIEVKQYWWGHLCDKWTRFYIVGVGALPLPIPFRAGEAPMVMQFSHKCRRRPQLKPRSLREATPPALAEWLVELARRTRKPLAQSEGKEGSRG